MAGARRGRGGAPLPAARSSSELAARPLRCTKTQTVCSGRKRRSRRIHPWPLRGRGSARAARTAAAPLSTPSAHMNKASNATKRNERNTERKRGRRRRSPRQEAGKGGSKHRATRRRWWRSGGLLSLREWSRSEGSEMGGRGRAARVLFQGKRGARGERRWGTWERGAGVVSGSS